MRHLVAISTDGLVTIILPNRAVLSYADGLPVTFSSSRYAVWVAGILDRDISR